MPLFGLCNYLKQWKSSSEVKSLILKQMKDKGIKYIVKITEKNGPEIRKIGYNCSLKEELNIIKKLIIEGIKPYSDKNNNKRCKRTRNTT